MATDDGVKGGLLRMLGRVWIPTLLAAATSACEAHADAEPAAAP